MLHKAVAPAFLFSLYFGNILPESVCFREMRFSQEQDIVWAQEMENPAQIVNGHGQLYTWARQPPFLVETER